MSVYVPSGSWGVGFLNQKTELHGRWNHPGKMFLLVNIGRGRIINDEEIKEKFNCVKVIPL